MRSKFVTLFVFLSLLAGCSEDTIVSNSHTVQEVFPLHVGNNWKYLWNEYGVLGDIIRRDTDFVHVDSVTSYNGKPAFALNGSMIYLYSGNDLMYVSSYNTTGESPLIILRYPVKVNESITVSDTTDPSGHQVLRTIRLASVDSIITVPAGTFKCLFYETYRIQGRAGELDTFFISQEYYALGVGRIKGNHYAYHNNGVKRPYVFEELHSYTVN
jgi:hypothetical protein